MFDFEKFPVYILSEKLYGIISKQILSKIDNRIMRDQLKRASLSIVLNIAEGAGKYSKPIRKISTSFLDDQSMSVLLLLGFGRSRKLSVKNYLMKFMSDLRRGVRCFLGW